MRLKPIQIKDQPTEFEKMVSEWSTDRLSYELWLIQGKISPYSKRERERIVDLGIKLKVPTYVPPEPEDAVYVDTNPIRDYEH